MSIAAGAVALIDNGGANVASVVHALARLGVTAERTASPERIAAADRVILPGVGAAADAIRDGLLDAGIELEDTPDGPRWSLRQGQ